MGSMTRRTILKTSGFAALGATTSAVMAEPPTPGSSGAAPIMQTFSAADHRRRLLNLQSSELAIRGCMKKHLITSYIPGQVSYNLGEYPSRKPYDPDEYDERELDRLRDGGIRLIQIMEDWNDMLRLFGGTKFTAVNPKGLRRFIDMAHRDRKSVV